jgi:hypothetical protein
VLPAKQELVKKRRIGRLQKAMGDYSLLAGSAVDAADHYQTAADLARACNDFIWLGAAIEGLAHARVCSAPAPCHTTACSHLVIGSKIGSPYGHHRVAALNVRCKRA